VMDWLQIPTLDSGPIPSIVSQLVDQERISQVHGVIFCGEHKCSEFPSVLWHCWLADMKLDQLVKISYTYPQRFSSGVPSLNRRV